MSSGVNNEPLACQAHFGGKDSQGQIPRGALAACLESCPIDLNVALKFQSSPIACQSVTLLRDSSTMRRGGCRWFPKWSEDRLGLTALAAGARLDGSDTRDPRQKLESV
ncbi:hypothetical protein LAV84_29590 [Rhizobium sp. VS19-DR104.2]|uniref:hypothetical protein n=1 Tax=unclassified Rhizobium TaxID=2613769 RepID=UPI001CC782BC|nr:MULTISPECIES: hypothetical protein [unclassified Rhizobium]MBZ5763615.1 hypothetical protein [Rhizobium sp. VS19-DR96]MBZ5769544.1 hypothetical protein [Rhizobium sp. VS19-DR129.2]MBZ5777107.1 hypothetical protein [Rhizobium sp. VS19-DRK62.2]MBZ5788239.1 hypothetical protein [Rhizobium sp. VS19-DR121]MBZ5805671.1 hypothetical protein [Rhizobium sp. VS19-DR181]